MVERGGHLGLALEALTELGVFGQLGGDELQRHDPVERKMGRAVDDAHAAAPGHRLETVAADDGADLELSHARLYTGWRRCRRKA